MRRAGLTVRMDAAGTMHGLLAAGRDGPRAGKRLLVGSHIDTVVDAGRFDGNLGVVAAILAVEELRRRGIALPFALEILAFGDEEGVRYPKTLIGSSTIAGVSANRMLDLTDADGITIRDALAEFGGDPDALAAEAYKRDDVLGYLEVHIEQGPVLERPASRSAWSAPSPARAAIASPCAARPAMPAPCRWPFATMRWPRPRR